MPNLPPQLTGQATSPMGGNPQMGEQMMMEYDQSPDTEEEIQKILAYFDREEVKALYENGLVSIDPETNLWDATILEKALKIPEIREAISSELSQETQSFAMGGEVEAGHPNDPELEKLRLQGTGDDKELVIITPFILETFSQLAGREPKINPENGLPEFGFFKSLIRIAAPIVGTFLGGPFGAAIAGGLATKLTGGSWGQALGAGALSGLGAYAAPSIGGFFQNQFPGFSSGLGQATRGLLGQNVGGGLANIFSPSTGGGIASPLARIGMGSVGQMIPGGAAQVAGQQGIQAAGQTGGGFLSNLLSGPLPLVGAGLLMARGNRDEQRGLRDYQRSLEEQGQRQRGERESMRERLGFNARLNPLVPYRRRQLEPNLTPEQYARGVEPLHFQTVAHGGAIRGSGKGQQDNIPTNLKEGSYIIDASTVSDIGDGSSDAGMNELDRYFSKIPSNNMNHHAQGGIIKAMVSDGEYRIDPEKVTAIGGGSNEKGAQILKKFVKEVRAKKRTSGNKLPPKSKPVGGYLKNIRHAIA